MPLTGFPLPPNIPMNLQAQTVMEILMGIGAVFGCAYLIREAVKQKSWLPIMLILGTFPAVFYEPVTDMLGLCIYPHQGQHTFLETFGRKIPVYLALAWLWYFGPFVWQFKKMFDAGTSAKIWWSVYIGAAIGCTVFEIAPLHFQLWHYYGNQPLRFMGMPVWWGLVNPIAIIGPAYVFHRLAPRLHGAKVLMGIPMLGMSIAGFHAAASLPVAVALNTSHGMAVTSFGALLSVLLTVMVCWFMFTESADEPLLVGVVERAPLAGRVHGAANG
jgi:hypothetical protein